MCKCREGRAAERLNAPVSRGLGGARERMCKCHEWRDALVEGCASVARGGQWVWNKGVERGCGARVWSVGVGLGCGTRVWSVGVGRGCGAWVWKKGVERGCGTRVWRVGKERGCGVGRQHTCRERVVIWMARMPCCSMSYSVATPATLYALFIAFCVALLACSCACATNAL